MLSKALSACHDSFSFFEEIRTILDRLTQAYATIESVKTIKNHVPTLKIAQNSRHVVKDI